MKLLLFFLFATTLTFANNPKMGVHLGLNNPFFSNDPEPTDPNDETDSKIGIDLGASFLYDIGASSILGEVSYVTYNGESPDASESFKLSFLEIRPNYLYNIHPQFFISAGLNFGIKLKAKVCEDNTCLDFGDFIELARVIDPTIEDPFKSTRVSINAGIGARFDAGMITLLPKIVYDLALSDTFEDDSSSGKVSALRFTIATLF